MNALDPDLVVLGGGLVEAFGNELVDRVRKHAAANLYADTARSEVVRRAALGDDAVALGAVQLARSG
jgi:predicted NBD/HSP70 family sugar kinase